MAVTRKLTALQPRRMTWDFSQCRKYWFNESPLLTHFLNAYTLLVPENEKYYIRTLSSCIENIEDMSQRSELHRFFQQESLHGVAHKNFWPHIGIAPRCIDFYIYVTNVLLYRFLEPIQPKSVRVSIVAAIEHLNSVWAHAFLDKDILVNADPELRRLFYWHFAEEIEHKTVADDARRGLYGSYINRLVGGVFAIPLFYLLFLSSVVYLLACDRKLFCLKNLEDLWYLLIKKEFLRYNIKELLRYLHPKFDPRDVDDYHLSRRVFGKYLPEQSQEIRNPSAFETTTVDNVAS